MFVYHHPPHWDNLTAPCGRPTVRVGYTLATAGRRDHKVHKGHVVAIWKKYFTYTLYNFELLYMIILPCILEKK
jgi:hypothetical protein